MMKRRSTAEIKKIKGVEIGGGYQIHILIKKNIKKECFDLLPVLSSFEKCDPGFMCLLYQRLLCV